MSFLPQIFLHVSLTDMDLKKHSHQTIITPKKINNFLIWSNKVRYL